ncbi:protein phosphatase CheZ [Candidatus Raskinella chloraquaticus]|uniref:Uncharacterized protein n=1 Tax=Candidatus Raskinella chloraquaticus TaxID=1951219 RepID=A0A1W9HWK5_9HYPH|nr:MAG: hypothetical protein A4S15_09945 [Proteobacteria bacterium SG_bin8]
MSLPLRRVFRIEESGKAAPSADRMATMRHTELLDKLEQLAEEFRNAKITSANEAPAQVIDQGAREMIDFCKVELDEARRMKAELTSIREAIDLTKQEIAALHVSNQTGGAMHRVSDELDAIVDGTESATNTILTATEKIETNAHNLAAKLKGDDQGMALDIQENILRIFEACNFQDLTGQRIQKIVNVLRFVDERVTQMMDIWGGMEEFEQVKPAMREEELDEEAHLLNGPALPDDGGRASQDMIDALFD